MPIDRSRIRKACFLVSDQPLPGYTPKREPMLAEFEHFEQAAEAADRLQAIDHNHRTAIRELTRRLEAVRQQLDGFKGGEAAMSATGAMSKALSELMQRHGQTLATPALVPLFEPTPDTDVAVRLLPQRSMSTLSA